MGTFSKARKTVAIAACLIVVTGCTPQPEPPAPPPVSTDSSSDAALTGDLGVATFTGSDGTAGSIRLSAADGRLALASDELDIPAATASSSGSVAVMAALDPIDEGATCFDIAFPMGLADAEPGKPYKAWRNLAEFHGDPTAIDQLVITTKPQNDPDCSMRIIAVADVQWSVKPQRSDLVAQDAGPRAAARGETTSTDGMPTSYTVARNDLAEDVAARFGMTADDLFYLNPFRFPSDEILRVGEELNLTVAAR
ncbi:MULTISPECIES: LysM domain-containing protein [unclassified Rathayibacter]|uniref:LysM peptidoglycan-binding domain-containing protein n=1 Tax=unclassified Rathayibacter TaxID=2609250 RepID=UPI0011B0D44C|nr:MULTISPECIES: LysM domain-containing protein [unclassified Rathayibacter]